MAGELSAAETSDLEAVLAALGQSWEGADGAGFAAQFTEDADFVNIFGMSLRGQAAVAAQHQHIFDTIYKGSHAVFSLAGARKLSEDIALAHVTAALDAPSGPRAGRTNTIATAVLARTGAGWRIAAFQNTVVAPPPG